MKRALALSAVLVSVVLAVGGCGHGAKGAARPAGTNGVPAAGTAVQTGSSGPAAGVPNPPTSGEVDGDITDLDNALSNVDKQASQADQAADSDQ